MGEIEARCLDSSAGDKGTWIGNNGRDFRRSGFRNAVVHCLFKQHQTGRMSNTIATNKVDFAVACEAMACVVVDGVTVNVRCPPLFSVVVRRVRQTAMIDYRTRPTTLN